MIRRIYNELIGRRVNFKDERFDLLSANRSASFRFEIVHSPSAGRVFYSSVFLFTDDRNFVRIFSGNFPPEGFATKGERTGFEFRKECLILFSVTPLIR